MKTYKKLDVPTFRIDDRKLLDIFQEDMCEQSICEGDCNSCIYHDINAELFKEYLILKLQS